ncbi:MAG TPA: Rho termination factor N-terminal domain-containing protein, partial [Polyangia bacterium]|nr:Rho termination factor N-terminal domain-containing protein [Polyangia bacterium]
MSSNSSTSNNPFAALAVSVTGQADASPASVGVDALAKLTLKQLQEAATTLRLSGFSKLKKDALVAAIWSAWQQQTADRV